MKKLLLVILTYLVSLLIFLNVMFISTILVLNFKYLYYFDISYLNIKNSSGFSEEKIIENYNYTIRFVNNDSLNEYSPPSLNSSQNGRDHFKEVKNIFSNIKALIIPFIIMILSGIFILKKFKFSNKYLKLSSMLLLGFPLLLVLIFSLDFDWAFIIFHKFLFNNNKWLFNPRYDEIITILPEDYFMHCALLVLSICIISGTVLMIIYNSKKNEFKGEN